MSGTSGLSPVTQYLAIEKNEQSYVQQADKTDAAIQSEVAHFESAAPSINSPEALLSDYRSLQVVLAAFDMSGDIGETGLLQKLMTQNPASSSSVAKTLGSAVDLRFAQYFSNWTTSPLSSSSVVSSIVSQFETNSFEQSEGTTSGLQQALYFTRTIQSSTSLAQIMTDPTQLAVVEEVTGQPSQFGELDYDQQVAILTKAVDVSKFSNPAYVAQYAQQYLVLNQINPQAAAPQPSTILDLFGASSSSSNSSNGSLLSLFT